MRRRAHHGWSQRSRRDGAAGSAAQRTHSLAQPLPPLGLRGCTLPVPQLLAPPPALRVSLFSSPRTGPK